MRVSPPPISGSAGSSRASAANLLKKSSSGPNMIEGRRITASGRAASTAFSPSALVARIGRRAILVGADRRDVDHARAMVGGGERDRFGAERLHGVEPLPAALEQDADQVDHDVGVAHRGLDRAGVAQVGLHRMDLADPAERLQMAGEVGPAHRDADAVVAPGQRPHQMAAEKAGAAEDRDQRVVVGLQGHGTALRGRDRLRRITGGAEGRPGAHGLVRSSH